MLMIAGEDRGHERHLSRSVAPAVNDVGEHDK